MNTINKPLDDSIKLSEENYIHLEKRVRQIATELDERGHGALWKSMSLPLLAKDLKRMAIRYNCYINSWATADSEGIHGAAECYCASDYNEDDDDSFGFIMDREEDRAVIIAFKWLADRHYFLPEKKQF